MLGSWLHGGSINDIFPPTLWGGKEMGSDDGPRTGSRPDAGAPFPVFEELSTCSYFQECHSRKKKSISWGTGMLGSVP